MSRLRVTDCSQVVSLSEFGQVRIHENAELLCEDGTVAAIGAAGSFAGEKGAVVSAQGGVVTPGLVDAHTHLVFGGNRARDLEMRSQGLSYQDIAAAGGGIKSTVAETRRLSFDQMVETGRKRVASAMATGTTTLEAKSGYGLDRDTEERTLRAYRTLSEQGPVQIVTTYLGMHSVPEGTIREAYVAEVCGKILPALANAGLVDAVDAFVEDRYFDHDDARALAESARQLGLALHLHVDQFSDSGGAVLAAELGAATADHLEHTGTTGIQAMLDAGVVPVLLPGSVLGLGLSKYPDARQMLDSGLPVVLASDFNPGSSPVLSLPLVMGLACRFMGMTPAEALAATTVCAARALGFADRGSLADGERADLAVWNARDYREIATYIGVNLCTGVVIAGEPYLASQ